MTRINGVTCHTLVQEINSICMVATRSAAVKSGVSRCSSWMLRESSTMGVCPSGNLLVLYVYQWCGLRPSFLGEDRSESKKSVLVLVLYAMVLVWPSWSWSWSCRSWCCVVKQGLVTLVVIMILKDTETFQVPGTIYSFSILCLEHHYCGDQQWRLLI